MPLLMDSMFKLVLTISAIYLAIVGLALMFAPLQFGIGAVPQDASSELIALLRLLGGPFLGIAVLNWMARTAEPSTTRNAVILANIVGFGTVAVNDVWGVATGQAREIAKVFLAVHLLFTAAFVAVAWDSMQSRKEQPGQFLSRAKKQRTGLQLVMHRPLGLICSDLRSTPL